MMGSDETTARGPATVVAPGTSNPQICKLFLTKPNTTSYQLGDESFEEANRHVRAALVMVQGKKLIGCKVAWATERWRGFGVEIFPSISAAIAHSEKLTGLSWQRYIDSWSILGTLEQPVEKRPRVPNAIYRLTLERVGRTVRRGPGSTFEAETAAEAEALARVGARTIIACDVSWATEEWTRYTVDVFDSFEALWEHNRQRAAQPRETIADAWSVLGLRTWEFREPNDPVGGA